MPSRLRINSNAVELFKQTGLNKLPREEMKKVDLDKSGIITKSEVSTIQQQAHLDGDAHLDGQEKQNLDRFFGRVDAPTTGTIGESSHLEGRGLKISDELKARYHEKFGYYAKPRLENWESFVADNMDKTPDDKVLEVNRFFNNNIRYKSDSRHWDKNDYWASPAESIASGFGDCEDYALAKYATLRRMGIPDSELRINYVRMKATGEAHMVLTYHPEGKEPLILDNYNKRLLSIRQRRDLSPVYNFNNTGMWLASGPKWDGRLVGGTERMKKFNSVKERMIQEGLSL